MYIFLILLVAVTGLLLILKLIATLTGRVSEHLLTGHFRALEALLEHNQLPDAWVEQLRKMAHGKSSLQEAAKPFLLKKIGQLTTYFEGSPFVESAEARALLLEELTVITQRWEKAEISEILAHYDLALSDLSALNKHHPHLNEDVR